MEEHTEVPAGLADALASVVADLIPTLRGRIPHGPAAALGRLGAPDAKPGVFGLQAGRPVARRGESAALSGLRSLGDPVSERLLGALELTLDALAVSIPHEVEVAVPGPDATPQAFGFGMIGGPSAETVTAVRLLDQLRPGVSALIVALVEELAGHEALVSLLEPPSELTGEEELAAAHGAAHLALAVAVAAPVLRRAGAPLLAGTSAAVVGVALGAVSALLSASPMPPAYAAALLAKRRAEYVLPVSASGSAEVRGHRFTLAERSVLGEADFSGNGLAVAIPGGVAVRTGQGEGQVPVSIRILEGAPDEVELDWWDEVVEFSWRAERGDATLSESASRHLRTPPWPGDFRVRVHAIGRDGEERERYELMLWQGPPGPDIVHKRGDRLGSIVRGEPVPDIVAPPEAAYRWIRGSLIGEAATVTVVGDASPAEVLRAFGADPAEPESAQELASAFDLDPWVTVLPVEGGVLAAEFNGFQGSLRPVLVSLSREGRTAGLFWNVNAVTRLSFADNGTVLASSELGHAEDITDPEVNRALAGLDFGSYRDRLEKGMLAVERYTGYRLRKEDLDRMVEEDVAYRILPHLPELYPEARDPDGSRAFPGHGPLGADTDRLAFVPEETLRELAWQAASAVTEHAGVAGDPVIAAVLTERRFGPEAELAARRSQLQDHREHAWLWQALHNATNPDPLAAAIGSLSAARYAAGPRGEDLLEHARRIARESPPPI
ncbi:hypothetical protein SAMN04489729_0255 [Amycolatopsis lurida]|uniref:Uncharacterized protein n=1 Tax=Amycolatopsis lurida NRRL 2430 TaxID=1460371 RepID=A0A2P2FYR7_AMYLU|nr:DUF6461 domain-containing protein [Amycolatopsis lurida]KFU81866.1 hypothetical protein BB31_08445 [Amycolatopsis lurida NRRL 2430]SEB32370.1 hypothetical protein SAMN04489729_0255 [Amycolatopsis lurida]